MKKVLLTGGAGFIGSHTCIELLKARFEIIIVDDGSIDGTQSTVYNFQKENKNIRLIERNSVKSLPLSIFEGIENSKFNSVMWLDADGSMDVESSKKIISVKVFDPNGREFLQTGNLFYNSSLRIDISKLKKGFFILNLNFDDGSSYRTKILITN